MKIHYVRQQVMEETQAINESADDLVIPGDWGVPPLVRTAVEYVAHCAALDCDLKHGQTALFWALLGMVSSHIRQKE